MILQALKSFLSQNTDRELEKLIENYFNFKKINNKLYVKVLGNWIEELNKKADIWKSGEIHMTREETFTKGVLIFRNLEKGGFATYYAPISEYWNEEDTYLMEARKAGRRECNIARVYILRDIRILFNEDFREQIKDDINAGFDVRIAFYEDIPEYARKDFGIWDEEVLCIVETRAVTALKEEVTGGKLSINLKDLNNAKKWKDEILLRSHEARRVIETIDQLSKEKIYLFQSMLEMEKLSASLCETSYIDEYNCSWYHNSWQYLRLLDLVSSPFWHADFYYAQLSMFSDEARTCPGNRTKKILISGTADYAILEMLCDSLKGDVRVEIDIVDKCDTPLEICKWYSSKNKSSHILNVNTSRQDIQNTNFQPDYFDLIITDAFLTRFENKGKQNVVNEWFRILKPMGKIITTVRTDRSNTPIPIKAKKSEAENFVARAKEKIVELEPLLNNLSKSIISKAGEYAKNMNSHSFKSDQEIILLFSSFYLTFDEKETVGEFDGKTTYLRIVAEKNVS
jgi:ubiquinone/menaquinone biosynthesis C-methylase UbiE